MFDALPTHFRRVWRYLLIPCGQTARNDLVIMPTKISVPRSIPSVDLHLNQVQMIPVGDPGGLTNIHTMPSFSSFYRDSPTPHQAESNRTLCSLCPRHEF